MAEIRHGIRHLLASPTLYDLFQRGVGAYAWHRRVLERYASEKLGNGASILDIGCGTGDVVSCLPPLINYHGFDRNAAYIAKAKRRFPACNIKFHCEEFDGTLANYDKFDVVLAIGLLHHLDDDEVIALMDSVGQVLAPGGLLITMDPVRTPQQSAIARFLVSHDRGKNVRTQPEYGQLARSTFGRVEEILDDKPMFIPYTGLILLCRPD